MKNTFRSLLGMCVVAMCAWMPTTSSADELVVASFFSDSVSRFDVDTGAYIGNYESGVGLDGALAARIGPDNLMYVASEGSNQIQRYNWQTGEFVDNFITGAGELAGPSALTWDTNGDLFVGSFNNNSVLKYNGTTGAFIETAVASGTQGLFGPDTGTVFGPDGKLYIPSYWTNRIIRHDVQTGISELLVSSIGRPREIEFKDGQMFVASETTDSIRRYNMDGTFVDDFIDPGSLIMDSPNGLEFVNGNWYVSSGTMHKVLKFDSNGSLVNANFIPAGTGGMVGPVFISSASVPEPSVFFCGGVGLVAIVTRRRSRRG